MLVQWGQTRPHQQEKTMKQLNMFERGKLSPLQREQLDKITATLNGMGCSYIIKTPDKEVLSNKEISTVHKRRPLKYPFGTWTNYIKPFIKDLKEGEVAFIPDGEFDNDDLLKNVNSTAANLWGPKTYIAVSREGGVEIMRGGV
jgi:hypothetical protein